MDNPEDNQPKPEDPGQVIEETNNTPEIENNEGEIEEQKEEEAQENKRNLVKSKTFDEEANYVGWPMPYPREVKSAHGADFKDADKGDKMQREESQEDIDDEMMRLMLIRNEQIEHENRVRGMFEAIEELEEKRRIREEEMLKIPRGDKKRRRKKNVQELSPEEEQEMIDNMPRFIEAEHALEELPERRRVKTREQQIKGETIVRNNIIDQQLRQKMRNILLNNSEKKRLYLMKSPKVKTALSRFWNILDKTFEAKITYEVCRNLNRKIWIFLLPVFQREAAIRIADNFLASLYIRHPETVTQVGFFEYMIHLAQIFLEVTDIEDNIIFYRYLLSRITEVEVLNLDGKSQIQQRTISIKFYDTQVLNADFSDKYNCESQMKNVLYCYEKFDSDDEILTSDDQCIKIRFLDDDKIVPIGVTTSKVLNKIHNDEEDYKTIAKIENEKEVFPFFEQEQSLFFNGFVIEDEELTSVLRLNPGLYTPYYYEMLKLKNGKQAYCNMRTIGEEQFSIDRVEKLKKRWKNPVEPPKPGEFELVGKPVTDIVSLLIRNKFRYNNFRDDSENYRDMTFRTSDYFQAIKSEKMEFLTTRENSLPTDNFEPYVEDIQRYANERSFNILVHGKPKIGKTRFCKELAKTLDLVLLDLEDLIQQLLVRTTEGEENQDFDDDDKPIEFLTPVERNIVTELRDGKRVSSANLIEFFKQEAARLKLDQRGFVFEVNSYQNPTNDLNLLQRIIDGEIKLSEFEEFQDEPFNFVIDLDYSEEEMNRRLKNILENHDIENFVLTSEVDRHNLKVQKERAIFMNSDEYEAPEDEEVEIPDPEEIKVLQKKELFKRVNEDRTCIQFAIDNYNQNILPIIEGIKSNLHFSNKINIDYATLTLEQSISTIKGALGPRAQILRPTAKLLEDAPEENYPALSMHELEVEGAADIIRRWSMFRKVDPVALFAGDVKQGASDFSADYAGRVFVFVDKENRDAFIHNPQKYLRQDPKLPSTYNIAIIGLSKSGKSTFSQQIAQEYGYQVIEFGDYMMKKYKEQIEWPEHKPSNPETGNIHFSKQEFDLIKKGGAFPKKCLLPLLLHDNGIELYERPPPPKEEGSDEELDDEERERREEEERKRKEEEAKKKKRKAKKKKAEEKNETTRHSQPDIALADLVPKPDENGQVPALKGFIFVDFPTSEEEINCLKEMNVKLDRIIVLREDEEEGDGAVVSKRPGFYEGANLEQEINNFATHLEALRENLEEDGFTEIVIGNEQETYLKILQYIDPFYVRVDDEDDQLPEDNGEGETLPYGEFAQYCPVTLVDEGWLVLGSEEFQCQVRGRIYRFYSEEFKEKFAKNITQYLNPHITPPEPRVFMTGCTGSGLKTQLSLLHSKLKVPILSMKNEFKDIFNKEKKERRALRRLMGNSKELEFEPPEEDSEEEYDEDEDSVLGVEDDEYERGDNEIAITNRILGQLGASLVDIRMDFPPEIKPIEFDFGDEEEEDEKNEEDDEREETDAERKAKLKAEKRKEKEERRIEREKLEEIETPETDLRTLLQESRKLPEIVLVLKPKKRVMLERKFDKKRITDEYQAIVDKIDEMKAEKKEKFEENRLIEMQRLIEEGEEVIEEEFMPFDADEVYASVPEPPNLNELLENEKNRLIELYEEQIGKNEALKDELEEIGIKVIMVQTDKSIERVFQKICHIIKPVLEDRETILTKHMAFEIKDSENDEEVTKAKKLQKFRKSYYYKDSRFGSKNPLEINSLTTTLEHPVVYKNRIYYLHSKEQVDLVLSNPKLYLQGNARADVEEFTPAPPLDTFLRPRIFLIGKYKSGKSTVAARAEEELGVIVVKMEEIIELFLTNKFSGLGRKLNECVRSGEKVSNTLAINLLAKRLKFMDIQERGFLLDGFPKTEEQAVLMYKHGIIPDLIFSDPMSELKIRKRAADKINSDFNYDKEIFNLRLKASIPNTEQLENLFDYNFSNLRYLTKKSTNARMNQMKVELRKLLGERQLAAMNLQLGKPFKANYVNLKQADIIKSFASSMGYCCVTYKRKSSYVKPNFISNPVVYYDRKFHILNGEEEFKKFSLSPQLYSTIDIDFNNLASMPSVKDKFESKLHFRGHCPVSLYLGKLNKSQEHIVLNYKNKSLGFSSVNSMRVFFKNPKLFEKVVLPEKLQIKLDKDSSETSRAKGDRTTLLTNELSRLVIKAMNQLSWARIKYPGISEKNTALKLMALCLKVTNPNKDHHYREKYKKNLKQFVTDCLLAKQVLEETQRRESELAISDKSKRDWSNFDEEHFLKLTEEFAGLMRSMDKETDNEYFDGFIR